MSDPDKGYAVAGVCLYVDWQPPEWKKKRLLKFLVTNRHNQELNNGSNNTKFC